MASLLTIHDRRRRLHGTRQILEFNWPQYALAGMAIALGLVVLRQATGPARHLIEAGVGLAAWWSVASIVAAYWVYDRSAETRWDWLPAHAGRPDRWLNIHAGFDETTAMLGELFPATSRWSVDLFDPVLMTEPSIARARLKSLPPVRQVSGRPSRLSFPDASQDAVFLLLSAHELRARHLRAALFAEIARVLAPGGRLLLAEHPRNSANFAAFGPGCWHFLPDRTWRQEPSAAGLSLADAFPLNPFVHAYVWRKSR